MSDPIPYMNLQAQMHSLRPEIDEALRLSLDRCSFCLGPEVMLFEQEFASFCGREYCVGVNSGTSALHLAMLLARVGPGDEVITTPYTFAATGWAISYTGARPVFVDIEPDTFNLDPNQVESAVTPNTKAILPVHLYGHPCEMESLLEIARRDEIALVEDAAQAHGARYKEKRVGGFGQSAAFSFYPGKNLGACGEGGALLTDNPEFAARARALREHGSYQRYYHDEIGFNYRMEGFQGAVLRVKLKRLASWTQRRRKIAQKYLELLSKTPLQLPREKEGCESAWHLFVVRHPRREELKNHLEMHRIGSAMHYPLPLHLQKCYRFLGYRKGSFPVAEQAAAECLSLPIYPELADEQVERVAAAITRFFHARVSSA